MPHAECAVCTMSYSLSEVNVNFRCTANVLCSYNKLRFALCLIMYVHLAVRFCGGDGGCLCLGPSCMARLAQTLMGAFFSEREAALFKTFVIVNFL